MLKLLLAALVAIPLLVPAPVQNGSGAAAWPGLWGPGRNGTTSLDVRPTGFKELWRRKVQGGYSQVAVAGGAAVTMESRDGTDYIVSLDPATGRQRWQTAIGPTYRGHDGSHDGPIATPSVDGNDIFAVGPHGLVIAVDASTGKEKWRHDLVKEFGAAAPVYGFGASTLIEGNAVLVQTGGEKSQGLLAFDRATGKLLWNARHGVGVGYSSPAASTAAGVRQVVVAAGDSVFAVSPADGKLLWQTKGLGNPESVANPPQFLTSDRVLVTSWQEAILLDITKDGDKLVATEKWRSPRLRNSYSPTVYRDGHLYGWSGAFLICVDAATGDVKWRHRTYEGTLIGAGQHLFVLGDSSGDLHVVEASPAGYKEVLKTRVLTPGARTLTAPSLAGNRLFVRNSEEVVAFAIEGR